MLNGSKTSSLGNACVVRRSSAEKRLLVGAHRRYTSGHTLPQGCQQTAYKKPKRGTFVLPVGWHYLLLTQVQVDDFTMTSSYPPVRSRVAEISGLLNFSSNSVSARARACVCVCVCLYTSTGSRISAVTVNFLQPVITRRQGTSELNSEPSMSYENKEAVDKQATFVLVIFL